MIDLPKIFKMFLIVIIGSGGGPNSIQNWPKTDTQTALASKLIIVEILFLGFLFPIA